MAIRPRWALTLCLLTSATLARGDDWPQWMGPQRDAIWRETGLLDKFPEGGPQILWRAPLHGGYAGPAVAGGKVFVTDFTGTGKGKPNPGQRDKIPGQERVLCLNAADGKEVWKHAYDCTYNISYPAGPRCTPTVHGGKVYTLGAEGHLFCLNAVDGKVIWAKDFQKDYGAKAPMWGFCGHPLVDGQKLICLVGGEGSIAVAFDKDTGKELWKALSAKETGYCPPTLIEAGGKRQLLIWHAQAINSLDPETGKVYWSEPLEPAYGMAVTAPVKGGDYLYASGIGGKAKLLHLATDKPAATVVWEGKRDTGVYCSNATPFLEAGLIFGNDCMTGHLRGVELETGKRLWETLEPVAAKRPVGHGTVFVVKNGDRFVLMSETGHLILAKLSAKGYEEVSRAKILEPTGDAFGRDVVWSHPAFADRCVFARKDKEIVCVALAK